jgi:HlyD family secretion protein
MAAMMLTAGIVSSCGKKISFTYTEVEVTRQDITTSVTATGTIEPVTSVDVGTQVSGIVSKLYVDYNSIVKAGDVIAELDRTNLLSELSSAQANLKSAQSELEYQQTNHDRYKTLYDKGLISANDYEQARLTYIRAQQTVTTQKENVKKAQTNLGYATITSPIDGVVLSKEVEEGQTVASSFNTPTLFTIAQDLTDMRVIADVDEADIGEVKEGQRVSFTVDAFPDDVFQGTVTQVRQQATTESNVVTYEVVISAPNADLKLKPGLTANITIYTLERSGVMSVPAGALRFTPEPSVFRNKYVI